MGRVSLLIAAALLPVSAARAQPSAPPPPASVTPASAANGAEILVKGRADAKPDDVRKQAATVSQMDDFYHEPLALFQDPICPGVMGIQADFAGIIVDRIRDIAERTRIRTAKLGACQPNILVVFVAHGQKDVQALADKYGYLFRNIPFSELKELMRDPGPVHVWNNTVVMGRYGDPVRGRKEEDGKIPIMSEPAHNSHIVLSHRRDILSSIILIDVKAIDGMSVVQIADYVAMRTLARTRPAQGDGPASTILSLFDSGAQRPQEITTFDLAYLRSLYSGMANLPASAKVGRVPHEIREELAKQDQPQARQP